MGVGERGRQAAGAAAASSSAGQQAYIGGRWGCVQGLWLIREVTGGPPVPLMETVGRLRGLPAERT